MKKGTASVWRLLALLWVPVCLVLVLGVVASGCGDGDRSRLVAGDGGPTGASPAVVACGRGESCPSEQICDPFQGCVQCLFDSHCGPDQRCDDRTCIDAVACASHANCADSPDTPVCDVSNGYCVPCVEDGNCSGNGRCVDRRCMSVHACVNSFDCPGNLVCDRANGRCVQCTSAGDCGGESACFNNQCVPLCLSDNECRHLNQLCDPQLLHCVECVENVDCPDVYHCVDGTCQLDVCEAGQETCLPGDVRTTCEEAGDSSRLEPCPARTTCVTGEPGASGATCSAWICEPSTSVCSADERNVESCAEDGLSLAEITDCTEAGQLCRSGACADVHCESNTWFCEANELRRCNGDGTQFETVEACAEGFYCDSTALTCSPQTCAPGSPMCVGNVATTCREDGSGPQMNGESCPEACDDGACAPIVCTPSTVFCGSDGHVHTCNLLGTASTVTTSCSSDTYCDEAAFGGPACVPDVCQPGTAVCSGDMLTVCDAEGSGPEPGGTDCTATGQVCFSGACQDVICAGSRDCIDGNVHTCQDRGTASTLTTTCAESQFCTTASGSVRCVADVCTPGSPYCAGDLSTTCNEEGSGGEPGGTDCRAANAACVSGTCLPIICEANRRFCDNGNVFLCGSTGTTSSLQQTCTDAQFCDPDATSLGAACAWDVCTAGELVCSGTTIAPCLPDGSGPDDSAATTDCADTGQACVNGACADIVCPAGERFCLSGNVEQCNATGTAFSRVDTCQPIEFCDDSSSPAICALDVCDEGQAACNAEVTTTCNSDGSGFVAGGTDCAASGQICGETVSCGPTATDLLGAATLSATASSARLFGIFYEVSTARTLTEIEAFATVTGTVLFTWAIYESTTATGTYNKVFESATTSSGTAQFHSSGAISFTLEAGKFYFIGVHVAAALTYFYSSDGFPQFVSFGRALNSGIFSGSSPSSTISTFSQSATVYHQRLTTAPPP